MHCFNLKAEEKFDPKKHVERVLGRVAEGDMTVACWEPGQVSPYHCHPNATEIYFCFEGGGTMKTPTETVTVAPGSFVVHPPGELHEWQTGPERTLLIRGRYGNDMAGRTKERPSNPGWKARTEDVEYFRVGCQETAMTQPDDEEGFGFAPEHDAPIPYMQRIRDYYQALGYGAPYRWAHYAKVPFTPLTKPLGESRVALVTTAAPYQPGKGEQGPGAPYNAATKFYTVYSGDGAADHDLRIAHVGYDRTHTTAEDSNTWFPLAQLRRAAATGLIGEVAPRFHGAPTNRSHRTTLDTDCAELLARVREDKADAVVLVAV